MAAPTMQDTVRTTSTAAAASIMWYRQGRPVYRRGLAPEGLCTASQLRAQRLSPAGLTPVAWLYFAYTGHQTCPLYAVEQARPIRALTDRQRAALAAGRALAGTAPCRVCAAVRVSVSKYRETICESCEQAREIAEYEEFLAQLAADRAAAAVWAADVLADPATVVLDTETTGLDGAYIVEIAVTDAAGNTLLDTRVNPQIPIPEDARAVHGIGDDTVASAPTFSDILTDLTRVLAGQRVIIYNAVFDISVLRNDLDRHYRMAEPTLDLAPNLDLFTMHPAARSWLKTVRAECAMQWYSRWFGDWSDYWGDYTWQPLGGGHSALSDCRAVLDRLRAMACSASDPAPIQE
ncbi:3'-5' exonuclease [Nocardia sp. NPDC019395]|uniref:3'-5' exonuclease n=1 Tax=Nocardia sp. NPDC019395 TaxID=3154686 RepID=UPI0033CE2D71